MSATDLDIQAGEPYARAIRLVDGKNIWATLAACEVRAQIRDNARETGALVSDLTPHLSAAFDANDIVVTLSMTGADTRAIGGGHYDLFISDTGAVDTHAIRLLYGKVNVTPAVTTGSGT